MDLELKGKVVIISGASQGIGKATAIRFAQEGVNVVLIARKEEGLRAVLKQIHSEGGKAISAAADVVIQEDRQKVIEIAIKEYGQLDILVNCAGIMENGDVESTSTELWRRTMDINVDAVFEMTKLAVPYLAKTKGSIINLSSVCGVRAFGGILAYAVSKAAVDQMTKCLALELAPKGIRVNCLSPGVVESNLHIAGGMDEKHYQEFLKKAAITHPLGRSGKPEEVADAILFMVSNRSAWTTGVSLSVDGGRALTTARA